MKSRFNKLKREIMPFLIAYVLFDIIIVGTICWGIHNVPEGTNMYNSFKIIFDGFLMNIISFKFFGGIFLEIGAFLNWSFWTLLVFVALFLGWKIKFAKFSEYDGKESGSSQWSKHGEEFDKLSDGKEILNKKDGFILSKDHYLGTDLKKF